MNRSTVATLSHLAHLAGTDPRGRHRELKPGVEAIVAEFARLRIEDPGAIERVDRLLHHIAGVQQGARRLREALIRERRQDAATPEVGPA